MAYYYVKTGGTATGDDGREATTPRTGSFGSMNANTYYANLSDVLSVPTTAVAAGDTVYISNSSNSQYGVATTLTFPTSGTAVTVVSVDDANVESYSVGANESCSGTNLDLSLIGYASFYGLYFTPSDDLLITNFRGGLFEDCVWDFRVDSANIPVISTNSNAILKNCNILLSSAGGSVDIDVGSIFEMYGGSIEHNGSTGTLFASATASSGTTLVRLVGTNLSEIASTLVASIGGGTDRAFKAEFHRCLLSTSLTAYTNEIFNNGASRMKVTNCGDSNDSPVIEYQYYEAAAGGDAEAITSTYRNQSVPFPLSGDRVSIMIDTATGAMVNRGFYFWFEPPVRYCRLSNESSDNLTFYLSCNDTLTNADIWIDVYYPDGTNQYTTRVVTSAPTNILTAGTTLTSDTGSTWTSGGSNKYKITLNTSSNPGADCVPMIRVFVAKRTTIYLDTQVDLS